VAEINDDDVVAKVGEVETKQDPDAVSKDLRPTKSTSDLVTMEGRFHSQSVVASAAIHAWMNRKLGGSFRTQAKLFTNPSEKDLAYSVRAAREYLQPRFVKLTGVTGKVLVQLSIGVMIMVISIYFFFVDGPGMIRTLMRLSPLDDAYELRLLGEFEKTSRAVVLASVLSALAQGFLAAVAFYFCGLQSVILLFMVTTVMSLIPFLGAASVWVPCAIYIGAVEQRYGAAIFLAIYGAAVVSSIDNVIKAYVLHGHSELHPLIALLSVLGGVPVFGPIGILIGPMVVVFLQTLLEILNQELVSPESSDAISTASEPSVTLPATDTNEVQLEHT
ncbi:MAG: AI-2E family transporter, partial [Acidobacteriota bacterium]